MTVKEFITEIQNYYGMSYRRDQLRYIVGYLEKQPLKNEIMLEEVIKTFSGQYKTLPDVAIFHSIVGAKRKEYMETEDIGMPPSYFFLDRKGKEVYKRASLGFKLSKTEMVLLESKNALPEETA